MPKSRAATTVVLPTYNEAGNLERLAEAIAASGVVTHLLVVDDNSPDGTGRIADALAARLDLVEVLHRPAKLGLGTAYQAGFREAIARGCERVVTMDADFSHHPRYLPELVDATDRADLAIGSRYAEGGTTVDWGLGRKLISRSANVVAIRTLALPTSDCTSGFRCYRRSLLEAIEFQSIRSSGYSFLVEALYRSVRYGARVTEIPIRFEDRKLDRSKISRVEILKGVQTIVRLSIERWRRS